jgi:hypothetical protein
MVVLRAVKLAVVLVDGEQRAERVRGEMRKGGRAPVRHGGLVACPNLVDGTSTGAQSPGGVHSLVAVGHALSSSFAQF